MRGALLLLCVAFCGGNAPERAAQTPVVTLPPPPPEIVDAGAPEAAATVVTFDTSWTEDGQAVGPEEMVVTVDFAALRAHAEGARVQAILAAQWQQLLPEKTEVLRDLDWLRQTGPSLVDASRDETFVRHALVDASIDHTFEALAKERSGTKVDLHVAGTKAWKVRIDRGESVLVRSPTHFVAVVPPARAAAVAGDLASHPPARPPMHAEEALRMKMRDPSHFVPAIPEDIGELRIWIDAHADATADVYFEGVAPSAEAAQTDADAVRTLIREKNTVLVRMITDNLLGGAVVAPAGNLVRMRVHASDAQIRVILAAVARQRGVSLPP